MTNVLKYTYTLCACFLVLCKHISIPKILMKYTKLTTAFLPATRIADNGPYLKLSSTTSLYFYTFVVCSG